MEINTTCRHPRCLATLPIYRNLQFTLRQLARLPVGWLAGLLDRLAGWAAGLQPAAHASNT